jgi:hypothetical protein
MAITVKHKFVSAIPDSGDTDIVQPSNWNDDHELTGTIPVANGGTGASTLTGYVKGTGTTAMTASATIPNTDVTGLGTMSTQDANNVAITGGTMSGVAITGYIPTSEKAQPLGVATLEAGGKVPTSQIPMQGDLNYQGTWNATTNTPTLTSSTGTQGYYYVVNVAGTTNLDGITDWQVGDWAIYNGTVWQKVDNTDAVSSVNGQTGTVVLTTTNIAEGTNEYFTTARARASVSAGTGISYDNSTGVITNSAPDQTVAISEGTGIDVTGTYPNFTVTNTAPDQTVAISAGTGISTSGTYPNFTVTNTAPDQTVALTGAGTTVVTGTYPNFTITSTDSTTGTVTSVAATAGTGISVSGSPITTSGTLTITNTAPDQVVSLTQGGTTTITGTYPNFTISSDDQYDGTVTSVGGTGTVNGLTLTGTVTTSGNLTLGGTLDLSAPPVIGGTTPNTITGTTINANTKVVSPDYYAQSILGGNLRTSGGTSLLNWDGGGSGNITVNGGLSANPSNKNISLAPTGTGTVTINPATAGTMDNVAIGGTTPASVAGTVIQATNGIVINSNTVSASYTIPAGSSGMSAGPMTVASGQTVTVSSGSRWVIL